MTSADLAPLVRESVERDPTIAANHLWPCIKEYVRVEWSANMLARLKETAAKELGFRATAFESASNLARIKLSAGGDHFGHAVDLFMVDAAKMRTIALHAAKLRHDLVQKCGGLSLSVFSRCLSSQRRAPANEPSTMPHQCFFPSGISGFADPRPFVLHMCAWDRIFPVPGEKNKAPRSAWSGSSSPLSARTLRSTARSRTGRGSVGALHAPRGTNRATQSATQIITRGSVTVTWRGARRAVRFFTGFFKTRIGTHA